MDITKRLLFFRLPFGHVARGKGDVTSYFFKIPIVSKLPQPFEAVNALALPQNDTIQCRRRRLFLSKKKLILLVFWREASALSFLRVRTSPARPLPVSPECSTPPTVLPRNSIQSKGMFFIGGTLKIGDDNARITQ